MSVSLGWLAAGSMGDGYFYGLVDAMTRMDMIANLGIEGYKTLIDGTFETHFKVYFKYSRPYSLIPVPPELEKILLEGTK